MQKADKIMPLIIKVPRRTLLVLCGPAGAGKSTFAAQRFGTTTVVSSDHCRELICDDITNQHVNRDAFDLFYFIVNKRLYNGRFTVADSTALQPEARRRLHELARRHGYLACLLIFKTSAATSFARNLKRDRKVEEHVIPYHTRLLEQALLDAPDEGWDQIHVLDENDVMNTQVEIDAR